MRIVASIALVALVALVELTARDAGAQSRRGGGSRTDTAAARMTPIDTPDELAIAVGETKTISARNVKNFSEGASGIIDVKLTTDASKFVIVGKKPGTTTLLLIYQDGTQTTINVSVSAQSMAVTEREVSQLIEGIDGIHFKRIGSRLVIDGRVSSDADMRRVQQVASLYPGQVEALVTLVKAGVAAPAAEQHYLIRIDFYFVQYDKNSSYTFGIGWPTAIGGNTVVQSSISYDLLANATKSATATLSNQPLPRLDMATVHGWAKVLKHSTVVASNGIEASFQSGGEQNFSVTQGLTAGVQKITFGSEVTVLPVYDPEAKAIDVKLTADISDLTAAASGSTLPGRITSKVRTSVNLKLGQALVLSGIRNRTDTNTMGGLPLLSEIPIIGLLFGSKATTTQESENAIFVVPNVVTSVPSASREMIESALLKFKSYEGNIDTVKAYRIEPEGALDVPPVEKK